MDTRNPPGRTFEPIRHDSHLVALFHDEAAAAAARDAVVAAGVDPATVQVVGDGDALHRGAPHPVQELFIPEDDYADYHHALARGRMLVIVRPASPEAREAASAALERAAPLDVEEHGRKWRGEAAPVDRMAINHANLSRADMKNRAVGGHDEVILDMTGQKMTVRTMSERDMAEAPFAPPLPPEARPAPLAPPPPPRQTLVRQTSYTYGVPADVVERMSPEEQVMAQPHSVQGPVGQTTRDTFLRVDSGETRLGWREAPPAGSRVRSYVTERPTAAAS